MCSSKDMITDRQTYTHWLPSASHTHTHTHRQTDTLITILCSPIGGRSNYAQTLQYTTSLHAATILHCNRYTGAHTCCWKTPWSFFCANCGKHMCSTFSIMIGGNDVPARSMLANRSRIATTQAVQQWLAAVISGPKTHVIIYFRLDTQQIYFYHVIILYIHYQVLHLTASLAAMRTVNFNYQLTNILWNYASIMLLANIFTDPTAELKSG